MTTSRELLADAASTVEGIKATPYYTRGNKPGHTFIRLERIDYPNRLGGIVRWNVVVVLPQDLALAEKFLEQKVPLIRAAVAPLMAVVEVVPQYLTITGVSDLLCVFITGTREEEE